MFEVTWDGMPDLLEHSRVVAILQAALEHGGRGGAGLSVVFVDEKTLTEMHSRHLGDDAPTDVITFDLGEEARGPVGELYVSVDRARESAGLRGCSIERELALYLVHGALHLCGFDDHDPRERAVMRRAEGSVLKGLGFPPDPMAHEFGGE